MVSALSCWRRVGRFFLFLISKVRFIGLCNTLAKFTT
nr:MAG TPA: hypothetical protein [Caudoviricetes sp.]